LLSSWVVLNEERKNSVPEPSPSPERAIAGCTLELRLPSACASRDSPMWSTKGGKFPAASARLLIA